MKTTLTKSEFIRRAMNGEVFELDGNKYFYDESRNSPFRYDESPIKYAWDKFNGINEFTVVEPEPETVTVYEWIAGHPMRESYFISDMLFTEEEANERWDNPIKTGRSFEVPKG